MAKNVVSFITMRDQYSPSYKNGWDKSKDEYFKIINDFQRNHPDVKILTTPAKMATPEQGD
jgi:hypothetical protein